MQEWWSYRPGDFLLFSPRTYWRLFQLANESLCVESFSEAQPHMEIWSFTVRRLSGVIPVYLTAFVLLSRLRPLLALRPA